MSGNGRETANTGFWRWSVMSKALNPAIHGIAIILEVLALLFALLFLISSFESSVLLAPVLLSLTLLMVIFAILFEMIRSNFKQ